MDHGLVIHRRQVAGPAPPGMLVGLAIGTILATDFGKKGALLVFVQCSGSRARWRSFVLKPEGWASVGGMP